MENLRGLEGAGASAQSWTSSKPKLLQGRSVQSGPIGQSVPNPSDLGGLPAFGEKPFSRRSSSTLSSAKSQPTLQPLPTIEEERAVVHSAPPGLMQFSEVRLLARRVDALPHLSELDAILSSFELDHTLLEPIYAIAGTMIQEFRSIRDIHIKHVKQSDDGNGVEILVVSSSRALTILQIVDKYISKHRETIRGFTIVANKLDAWNVRISFEIKGIN